MMLEDEALLPYTTGGWLCVGGVVVGSLAWWGARMRVGGWCVWQEGLVVGLVCWLSRTIYWVDRSGR